jgi:hypothetical protein
MPKLIDVYKHETMPDAFDPLQAEQDKNFEQTR